MRNDIGLLLRGPGWAPTITDADLSLSVWFKAVTRDGSISRAGSGGRKVRTRYTHATTALVVIAGVLVGRGTAYCSERDSYRKLEGRRIALGRALQTLPRHTRGRVWQAWFRHLGDGVRAAAVAKTLGGSGGESTADAGCA